MAGYTLSNLQTDIRNYTEVDSNVFTTAILNRFIENAEHRINLDCPMDSDRFQDEAQFATDFNTITMPTKLLYEDDLARALQEDGSSASAYITPQTYYPNI